MLYPVNTDIKIYLLSILLKMDSEAKLATNDRDNATRSKYLQKKLENI